MRIRYYRRGERGEKDRRGEKRAGAGRGDERREIEETRGQGRRGEER